MDKIVYKLVYNRKNRLNEQGQALVQVEAYLKRRKCYFGTHLYLKPSQWDTKKGLVKNHANAAALNQWLRAFMASIEKAELELWQQGRDVTLPLLKEALDREGRRLSFIDFYRTQMERLKMKPSTRCNHRSTLKLLQHFRADIDLRDVTYELLLEFEHFLFGQGYHINTVAKHMKHMKRYVNMAIDQGLMTMQSYAFRKYRIKTVENHHSHLTPEELGKLEQLELPVSRQGMRHSLDAFLFCCYAGLRYSDFTHLTEANLIPIDGNCWLCYRSVKTGIEVRSPLYLLFDGKAEKVLARYKERLDDFFRLKCNSNVNKQLQALSRAAGLEKHISFHSARHTHATLLIYSGVSITTVQKLLGHRNVRTTEVYTNIMDRTIVNDLMQHKHTGKAGEVPLKRRRVMPLGSSRR